LLVFAPLGFYVSQLTHNWLLNANLFYLLAYSAVISVLFFGLCLLLQKMLGSKSLVLN
jgi:hypothetical protein